MFCDYHTHTVFSDDSNYPMEECVKDAISLGIKEICFTDHVDYGVKYDLKDLKPEEVEGKVLNVDFEKYEVIDGVRVRRGNETKDWYGPINAGVTLVWKLF